MIKIKRILKQFINFILISGTGWIIDFIVFYFLANKLNFHVGCSNLLSAIPAVTFVFMLSTNKIFANNNSRLTIKTKYFIYFIYQLILVSCVSILGQYLYDLFSSSLLITGTLIAINLKVFAKLCITPITIFINFVVMKFLLEKL